MTISWRQKAWHNVKGSRTGERTCWRWEGTRSDGRTFIVIHIPAQGYIASSFNGTRLGTPGKTLAQAQALCLAAVSVKVAKAA